MGPAASVRGGVWVGVGVGTERSLLSSCAHSTFRLSEGLALGSLTDGPVLVYLCIPYVSPVAGRGSGMFVCFCEGKHILKSSQIECMERESS